MKESDDFISFRPLSAIQSNINDVLPKRSLTNNNNNELPTTPKNQLIEFFTYRVRNPTGYLSEIRIGFEVVIGIIWNLSLL